LAFDAENGVRQRVQARRVDLLAARLADAVLAALEPREGMLDGAQLFHVAIDFREIQVHEDVGRRVIFGIGGPLHEVLDLLAALFLDLAADVGPERVVAFACLRSAFPVAMTFSTGMTSLRTPKH
jgi:hypothetical protein